MCSGSEAGSYVRLIDSVYHSTLGLRVIKKKKKRSRDAHALHIAHGACAICKNCESRMVLFKFLQNLKQNQDRCLVFRERLFFRPCFAFTKFRFLERAFVSPLFRLDEMLLSVDTRAMCSGSEEGSYSRLIDFCITKL